MLYYERKLKKSGIRFVIGVDEAGRGPLAGPVVAAAAYLTRERFQNRIDDSKKLSSLQREKAYQEITKHAVYSVASSSEKVIDEIGILAATVIAMEQAIQNVITQLGTGSNKSFHIIVDGAIKFKKDFSYTSIIRGDGKSMSIAAASILAKVTRDRLMRKYDTEFPQYNFQQHKGYPTPEHVRALHQYGPSPIHRRTFSYAGA